MLSSTSNPADLDIAVVDVETTGFAAERTDRVVEIAIVRLSQSGEVLDEFETLVNPQRDVGPTQIHGISARDVRQAPVFAEVAGDVAARLEGGGASPAARARAPGHGGG